MTIHYIMLESVRSGVNPYRLLFTRTKRLDRRGEETRGGAVGMQVEVMVQII